MAGNKKNTDTSIASRQTAILILLAVLKEGRSLSSLNQKTEHLDPADAAFARMLSFGVLRFYQQLQALIKPFIKKPLKAKDLDIQLTMLIALYQIIHSRVPDYAVVDTAVKQIRKSRKQWAAKMVNGVLRNFLRQLENTDAETLVNELKTEEALFSHPQWIIERIKHDWPETWQQILQGNNKQAPMTLRINQQKTKLDEYIKLLKNECELVAEKIPGITAALVPEQARDVKQLPGFEDGWVSVQDAGAQLAAQILQPAAGDYILDACAAPGGKTVHLFEMQPQIEITALDISATRLQRVKENCQRSGFNPVLIAADATATDDWWQGRQFDKILLDVPCSATGVIRRHPDIKHLRREQDIDTLVQLQREILTKNWPLLKPGGTLLYATCSLFKAENEQQIKWFLKNNKDARSLAFADYVEKIENVKTGNPGIQLFPVAENNDGFYYALIQKSVQPDLALK